MAQEMHVSARWETGWRFEAETDSGFHVALDGQEPHMAMSPMEMLLVALAGCTGVSVISVLQKMHQDVTGYELRVNGVRAATHPKIFVEIAVEHILTGHHVRQESVERAIELPETRHCGVEVRRSKPAHITHHYCIPES